MWYQKLNIFSGNIDVNIKTNKMSKKILTEDTKVGHLSGFLICIEMPKLYFNYY